MKNFNLFQCHCDIVYTEFDASGWMIAQTFIPAKQLHSAEQHITEQNTNEYGKC